MLAREDHRARGPCDMHGNLLHHFCSEHTRRRSSCCSAETCSYLRGDRRAFTSTDCQSYRSAAARTGEHGLTYSDGSVSEDCRDCFDVSFGSEALGQRFFTDPRANASTGMTGYWPLASLSIPRPLVRILSPCLDADIGIWLAFPRVD